MINKTADVQTNEIGDCTIIHQFAVVMPNTKIGEECVIQSHVYIDSNVVVANRVKIGNGARFFTGTVLEDDVDIGPNVVVGSSPYLLSAEVGSTVIRKGAWIGANSTLHPGINVGAGAQIAAGTVVTNDVPPKSIVSGSPAKIVGYTGTEEKKTSITGQAGSLESSKVKGVQLHRIQNVKDLRGDLAAIEWERELPFTPKRAFFVYNVPNSSVRGEHAHKACHQFLLCLHGSIAVIVDDGQRREEFLLNEPHIGIHIPPKVWGIQYKYSSDAVLFVLASHEYDPTDYLRDYDDYLEYMKL